MSGNKDTLQLLRSRMEDYSSDQKREFLEEVKKITAYNAAMGKFKSGGTIKEVCRLMERFLNQRVAQFSYLLSSLPFEYTTRLEDELYSIVDKHFDNKYSDFRGEYQKLIDQVASGESAINAANDLANTANKNVVEKVKLDTQQELLQLSRMATGTKHRSILLYIEIFLLLVTTFLAGMWAVDAGGNYEPFIVLLAVTSALLEIFRRFIKPKA